MKDKSADLTIEEAIAKLAQEIHDKNPETRSEDSSPFPLAYYLHLVELAPESTIYPYCRGAKLLYDWLAGRRGKEISYPLPPSAPELEPVPKLAQGYLTGEVAKILAGKPSSYVDFPAYLRRLEYIHRSIHYVHTSIHTRNSTPAHQHTSTPAYRG